MPRRTYDIPPNQTIYLNNLNEKLSKSDLKQALYLLFSQHGNILDIVCQKNMKMRGQAWIIFDQLSAATKSIREMQGNDFYGKKMRVSYAKGKSDVVAKMDGTYKAKRKAADEPSKKASLQKKKKPEPPTPKPRPVKKSSNVTSGRPEQPAPPNRILFIENLPRECTSMMLAMLFQQYQGYQQVRLVDGKPGIAFVDFSNSFQAGQALDALQGFKITPTHLMKVAYAKR